MDAGASAGAVPGRASEKTLGALIAYLVAVKLLFMVLPVRYPMEGQQGLFSFLVIGVVAAIAYAGLHLSRRVGFPEFWDARVSSWQRFGIPTLVGVGYGTLEMLRDLPSPKTGIWVALPAGVFFYSYGAILLEVLLRLFGLPLLLWLLSNLLLRGRLRGAMFWVAALAIAWYEPLPSLQHSLAEQPHVAWVGLIYKSLVSPLFIGNLVGALLARRYGWLSALQLRLSQYLVWHILYGGARL
jgi:hypothetical protein